MDREREPLPTRIQATAPLSPAYADALDLGLDALDLTLTPVARAAIDGHIRLLLAWTVAINLTAIRHQKSVAIGHVVDSLSAAPWLARRGVDRMLDLGSGGGFPGLPLAAALPGTHVTLLEPVGKKARFLVTATIATGLDRRVAVLTERAETVAADRRRRGSWSVVTARAVASTADLVELAFPLLERGGTLVAWKRGDLGSELAAADRAIETLGGGNVATIEVPVADLADHRLVAITRTGRVPDGYPRDPAVRRRQPW